MSDKVLELRNLLSQDDPARFISTTWDSLNMQRNDKVREWMELRNYIFATDTSTTSNNKLPWKNSTTIPKICQIRDNLHSNYISAIFPNDNWLVWEAYTSDAAYHQKAATITGYMENKCRESHFRTEVSKLLYDYIDYGNAFATVSYESKYKKMADGSIVPDYIGPRLHRISPLDIVFNPLADSLGNTYKVLRSIKTLGEIAKMAQNEPEQTFWGDALQRRMKIQQALGTGYRYEDFEKACGYQADGFGNMMEYYQSNNMEVLEFYGDYYDQNSGELQTDRVITIVDRSFMVRNEVIPTWFGGAPIYHVGWRFRQDNLWAMGPLDNLVGMQYRIDHLENLKADAMDLIVHPPLKIIGEVEAFTWAPGEEIHLDEGGDIGEVATNLNGIAVANNDIQALEDRMELYAGAPRQAMGIRTPGEKTAFEVQSLDNAAGRIFQEKTTNFEVELFEPALNGMLETARRNMDGSDIVRVIDKDYSVEEFTAITRDDITANGIIRPVGARHFAKQAQDLQNIIGVFNSPIGQMIAPHTSGKEMTNLVSDIIGLRGYDLFRPNVAIAEQQETQALAQTGQENLAVQASQPVPQGV